MRITPFVNTASAAAQTAAPTSVCWTMQKTTPKAAAS